MSYSKFRCNETTPVITLHADTLVIDENTIELIEENSQTSIELSKWEEDKPRQFLKVRLMFVDEPLD